MGNNTTFPRLYDSNSPGDLARAQENISSVLTPLSKAVQATPIMGAPPPAWIQASLLPPWLSLAALSVASPAFHKDALGYVHVKGGVLNNGGVASTATIFTLPVGYRPKEINFWPAKGDAVVPENVRINPNGAVIPSSVAAGQGITISLSFLAEQ